MARMVVLFTRPPTCLAVSAHQHEGLWASLSASVVRDRVHDEHAYAC